MPSATRDLGCVDQLFDAMPQLASGALGLVGPAGKEFTSVGSIKGWEVRSETAEVSRRHWWGWGLDETRAAAAND